MGSRGSQLVEPLPGCQINPISTMAHTFSYSFLALFGHASTMPYYLPGLLWSRLLCPSNLKLLNSVVTPCLPFIGLQTYLSAVLPIPPLASVGVGFCPLRPLGTTIHPRSPWIHTDLFKSNFSIQIHIHFILPGCLLLLRSFVRQTLWARESSHNYINGLSLSLRCPQLCLCGNRT